MQSASGAKIISQAPTAKQGGALNGGGAFLWHTKKSLIHAIKNRRRSEGERRRAKA